MHDLSIAVFSFCGHQHLLPYCLRSIYKNAPACREIILVWDDNIDWFPINFDRVRGESGVDFRVVKQSAITDWPESIVKWGWIKQQLAKLFCWRYSDTQWNWIVDGDVLITGDPMLFRDDSPILRYDSDQCVSEGYKFFMSKYLGIHKYHDHAFVGSSCLFDSAQCKSLDQLCWEKNHCDLVQAVNHMLTTQSYPDLPFSEFECYGHHVWSQNIALLEPKNWNYVSHQQNWQQAIQIAWADNAASDLDFRYDKLINHRDPESCKVDH
jgi:hypothetical protein